jgi:hypothetical protein
MGFEAAASCLTGRRSNQLSLLPPIDFTLPKAEFSSA